MSSVKFWGNWIHPGNCAVGDINIILAKASSCYHNVWIRLWITSVTVYVHVPGNLAVEFSVCVCWAIAC